MRALILLSVLLLTACGGSGGDSGPAPVGGPVEPPAKATGTDDLPSSGFYVGYITHNGVDYWSEAMLTEDGWLYFHTDSSPGWSGASSPMLFFGKIDQEHLDQWTTIRALGEDCNLASSTGLGCKGDQTVEIYKLQVKASAGQGILDGLFAVTYYDLEFDLQWTVNYPFSLYAPSLHYIDSPASLASVQGMYQEGDTEFTEQTGMVITVDGAGNMFFQSPVNGCTGNGTVTPYLDGTLNAYQAQLLLENCTGDYAYLNGQLEGFATLDSGYWWGDSELGPDLYIWLASPEGTASPVALTMRGAQL